MDKVIIVSFLGFVMTFFPELVKGKYNLTHEPSNIQKFITRLFGIVILFACSVYIFNLIL